MERAQGCWFAMGGELEGQAVMWFLVATFRPAFFPWIVPGVENNTMERAQGCWFCSLILFNKGS